MRSFRWKVNQSKRYIDSRTRCLLQAVIVGSIRRSWNPQFRVDIEPSLSVRPSDRWRVPGEPQEKKRLLLIGGMPKNDSPRSVPSAWMTIRTVTGATSVGTMRKP